MDGKRKKYDKSRGRPCRKKEEKKFKYLCKTF